MENVKEYDWLVANLNNPNFIEADFQNVGLTAENTQLLDRDTYKKSEYIQEKFTGEDGKFNEVLFDKAYDAVAQRFQNFVNKQYEDNVFKSLSYDAFDALRPDEGPIALHKLVFDVVNNPQKLKTGISSVGFTDSPEYSAASLAESSKVYNYETKEYESYTPDELALFESPINFVKSLFQPLVLALWEEDGEHKDLWSGRTVKHKKGDFKLNEDGNYYYETLGGRDPYGKHFRSVFDNITSENSAGNAYDFFDSNDLDKSTSGIVAKLVALVAPLFIPGVNAVYSYLLLGTTLADIIPNLYKSTIGMAVDNDEITKAMNSLQGFGKTMKSGISETGQRKMLGLENIANIVSDVALQWAEQRAIFKLTGKITGTKKVAEEAAKDAQALALETAKKKALEAERMAAFKAGRLEDFNSDVYKTTFEDTYVRALEMANTVQANKLEQIMKAKNRIGANVSLGYMAMMQGLDTYSDALSQGATKGQAAIWTWGAVAGMYAVDRTGLGELFFPELRDAGSKVATRKAIDSVSKEINKGFKRELSNASNDLKGFAYLWDRGKKASYNFWNDVQSHSTTFAEKAFGEGLEEVAEELCIDLAKSTNNLFYALGWKPDEWVKLNAFENAGERYAANFLGGAIGGAVFAGIDIGQNLKNSNQSNLELIYLLRNGKKDDILKELEVWKEKGLLGNKELSAVNGSTIEEDGSKTKKWIWATGTKEDNQNDAVYGMIKGYIESLDLAIHTNGLDFSDPAILDKMIMGDERVRALLSFDSENSLMLDGYKGTMLNDWNTVVTNIINKDAEIVDYLKQASDPEKRNDPRYQEGLNKLIHDKLELLKERDKFLDGTYSKYYLELTLFNINTGVNKFFFAPNFSLFAQFMFNLPYQDLTPALINQAKLEYEVYATKTKIEKSKKAFELFNFAQKLLAKNIGREGEKFEEYNQYRKFIREKLANPNVDSSEEIFEDWQNLRQAWSDLIEGNIEAVGEDLKTPQGFDINPRVKSDFLVQPVPTKKLIFSNEDGTTSEESDEQFNRRKNRVIEDNKYAISNIKYLIYRIQKTGYVDEDVKLEILQLLGYDQALKDILDADVSKLTELDILSPETLSLILELLNSNTVQKVNDNIAKIKAHLETLNKDELRAAIKDLYFTEEDWDENDMNYPLSSLDIEISRDAYELDEEGTLDEVVKHILNYANSQLESVLLSIQSSESITEGQKLMDLKTSPLDALISSFSVNVLGGTKLEIFDVLKREKDHLRTSQMIQDYVMNGNADREIQEAEAILNMLEAVVSASSTDTDGFGHNAIIKNFVEKYFPKEDTPGIINDDNAAALIEAISEYRSQLYFLKKLSEINKVNQFGEQSRAGIRVTKLLGNSLLEKLKHFKKYNGISLLDGVEQLDLSALTNPDINDNEQAYSLITQLEHLIWSNFQRMKDVDKNVSVSTIIKQIFDSSVISKAFNSSELNNNSTSRLNSLIKRLTDYDVFNYIKATLGLDRNIFNHALLEVLHSPSIKFAPLINLLMAARITTAEGTSEGKEVADAFMYEVYGDDYLNNTVYIDGMGGAGKTSVVAYLTLEVGKRLENGTIWKVGPTQNLLDNLRDSLGDDGRFILANEVLKEFITDDAVAKLNNYIQTSNLDNEFYKIETVANNYKRIVIKDIPLKVLLDKPNKIFIDEATYLDTLFYKILSYIAKQLNIQIVTIGDLKQNGVTSQSLQIGNLNTFDANTTRTPRLDISMRISNVQKKDNVTKTLIGLNEIDPDLKLQEIKENNPNLKHSDAAMKAMNEAILAWKDFTEDFELHYYEDNTTLNGEKIIDSLTQLDLEKLASFKKPDGSTYKIGLVTDDTDSATAKMVLLFKENNPDLDIEIYSPKSVQGSERDFFIIDTAVKISKDSADTDENLKFMHNFYTMITRSKKGTLIIDNGLTLVFKLSIKDPSTGESPDPAEIIKKYQENFLNILTNVVQANPITTQQQLSLTKPALNQQEEQQTNQASNASTLLEAIEASPVEQIPDNIKQGTKLEIYGDDGTKLENHLYVVTNVLEVTNDSGSSPTTITLVTIQNITSGVTLTLPMEELTERLNSSMVLLSTTKEPEQINPNEGLARSVEGGVTINPNSTEPIKIPVDQLPTLAEDLTLGVHDGNEPLTDETKELAVSSILGVLQPNPLDTNGLAVPQESTLAENLSTTDAINDVRVYGFYLRGGCNTQTREIDGKKIIQYYKRESKETNGRVEDVNFLMEGENEGNPTILTRSTYETRLKGLEMIRELIQSGMIDTITLKDFKTILGNIIGTTGLILFWSARADKAAFENGKFYLRIKKYDSNYDLALFKTGYDQAKEKGNGFCYHLVYRGICTMIGREGQEVEITLGQLPNPDTWKQFIESIPSDQMNNYSKASLNEDNLNHYSSYYEQCANLAKTSDSPIYKEIDRSHIQIGETGVKSAYTRIVKAIAGDTIPTGAFTREVEVDGLKKTYLIQDFARFKEQNPTAECSEPYIFAGLAGLKSNDTAYQAIKLALSALNFDEKRIQQLNGKAIAFVTSYPNIVHSLYESNNLKDCYVKLQSNGNAPLVRMMILNPKSIYSFDTESPTGDIVMGFLSTKQMFDEKTKGAVTSYSSITTAAKLFTALWNYRAGILRVNEILERNKDADKKTINDILKNTKSAFRLMDDSDAMHRYSSDKTSFAHYLSGPFNGDEENPDYVMGTRESGSKRLAIFVSKDGAKLLRDILNEMLGYLVQLVPELNTLLQNGDLKPNNFIASQKENGIISLDRIIQVWRESVRKGDQCKLLLTNDDGEVVELSGLTTSESLLIALSKMIKICAMEARHENDYKIKLVIKEEGKKCIEILFNFNEKERYPFVSVIDSIFEGISNDKRATIMRSMFNLIFHGQPVVKKVMEKTSVYGGYAPFPYGFEYRSTYKIREDSKRDPYGLFFPAAGAASDYTYDAAVEKGNYLISIPLNNGTAPETNVVTKNNQKKLNDLFDTIKNLNFVGIDIHSIINEALKEFDKNGDSSFPKISKELFNKLETQISGAINEHILKTPDNDLILSYKRDKRSNKFTFTTLTLAIGSLSMADINNYEINGNEITVFTKGNSKFVYTIKGDKLTLKESTNGADAKNIPETGKNGEVEIKTKVLSLSLEAIKSINYLLADDNFLTIVSKVREDDDGFDLEKAQRLNAILALYYVLTSSITVDNKEVYFSDSYGFNQLYKQQFLERIAQIQSIKLFRDLMDNAETSASENIEDDFLNISIAFGQPEINTEQNTSDPFAFIRNDFGLSSQTANNLIDNIKVVIEAITSENTTDSNCHIRN